MHLCQCHLKESLLVVRLCDIMYRKDAFITKAQLLTQGRSLKSIIVYVFCREFQKLPTKILTKL